MITAAASETRCRTTDGRGRRMRITGPFTEHALCVKRRRRRAAAAAVNLKGLFKRSLYQEEGNAAASEKLGNGATKKPDLFCPREGCGGQGQGQCFDSLAAA